MAAVSAKQPVMHWRQIQSLLRSNRAGVRWLSQNLCPCREEIPTQSKVGGLAAKTSLDQLLVFKIKLPYRKPSKNKLIQKFLKFTR